MAERPAAALILDSLHPGRRFGDWEIAPADLRRLLRSGGAVRHLFQHPSARLLVDDLDKAHSPKAIFALRLLTTGPAWIEDRHGRRRPIGAGLLARLLAAYVRDAAKASQVVREAECEVTQLEMMTGVARGSRRFIREAGVIFLRTDWQRGVRAGGSVAHIAGVINELQAQIGNVDFLTTDEVATLGPLIRTELVKAEARTWTRPEIHQLHLNRRLAAAVAPLAAPGRLVYQRCGAFNWTGAALARGAGLPLVLEFNGSEVWLAENWGQGLRYPSLAHRIEQLNFEAADVITVVSEPLREYVLARGIPDERILVNPNGVDAARFSPNLNGCAVRGCYGIGEECVIGFIGTFGPWHGAEQLAESFADLLDRRLEIRSRVRLLLIGDGVRLTAVKEILTRRGCLDRAILTGLVPQTEGPDYLAACDILALPTMPNPDGSVFFGSPTKLFEYMAMGRAIVATAVGQVSDLLLGERTALLVPPAEPHTFSKALERLVDDSSLRERLGAAAREQVLQQYTWKDHVRRVLDRVEDLTAAPATT
jgi:glycosyltransferase involved in cell wall biosynthesis